MLPSLLRYAFEVVRLGFRRTLTAIGRQLKLAGCAKLTERTSGSIVADDPDGAIAGRKGAGFSVGKWLNVFGARWKPVIRFDPPALPTAVRRGCLGWRYGRIQLTLCPSSV